MHNIKCTIWTIVSAQHSNTKATHTAVRPSPPHFSRALSSCKTETPHPFHTSSPFFLPQPLAITVPHAVSRNVTHIRRITEQLSFGAGLFNLALYLQDSFIQNLGTESDIFHLFKEILLKLCKYLSLGNTIFAKYFVMALFWTLWCSEMHGDSS